MVPLDSGTTPSPVGLSRPWERRKNEGSGAGSPAEGEKGGGREMAAGFWVLGFPGGVRR